MKETVYGLRYHYWPYHYASISIYQGRAVIVISSFFNLRAPGVWVQIDQKRLKVVKLNCWMDEDAVSGLNFNLGKFFLLLDFHVDASFERVTSPVPV